MWQLAHDFESAGLAWEFDGLREIGLIVAKENVCRVSGRGHERDFDAIENSWFLGSSGSRGLKWQARFKVAGEKKQGSFPIGCLVRSFVGFFADCVSFEFFFVSACKIPWSRH